MRHRPFAGFAQHGPTSSGLRTVQLVIAAHLVATVLILAGPANAAAVQDDPSSDSHWGIGLAGAALQKPYKGIDLDTLAFPIIAYENKWLSINGPLIALKLPSAGPLTFSLNAGYSKDGYDANDAAILAGMADRKDAIWAGGTVTWRNPIVNLSVTALKDASGNSEGAQARMTAEHAFELGRFTLTPHLAAAWVDGKYVNYYYGVRADEVAIGRPYYAPKATVNDEAGLRASFAVTRKDSIFADVSFQSLGAEIKNSPLVDGSTSSSAFVGYLHRF